jgi:hypothetical protein
MSKQEDEEYYDLLRQYIDDLGSCILGSIPDGYPNPMTPKHIRKLERLCLLLALVFPFTKDRFRADDINDSIKYYVRYVIRQKRV